VHCQRKSDQDPANYNGKKGISRQIVLQHEGQAEAAREMAQIGQKYVLFEKLDSILEHDPDLL